MKLISIRKMKKRINVPANVKMGRICAIWLFCIALQAVSIPILAQSAKITLRLKNVTVEEVLTSIENQTEYRFLYNKDILDVSRIVSISVKNELMTLVLDKLFKGEGVSYTIEKRQIVLNKVSSQQQDNKQPRTIRLHQSINPMIFDSQPSNAVKAKRRNSQRGTQAHRMRQQFFYIC